MAEFTMNTRWEGEYKYIVWYDPVTESINSGNCHIRYKEKDSHVSLAIR